MTEKKNEQIPNGLVYINDFITKEEASDLVKFIDTQVWSSDITRRTQQYGYKYDYKSSTASEKTLPIPKEFKQLMSKLEKFYGKGIDQIIINEYTQLQSIAKHVDRTDTFGEVVTSLSLLQPIGMKFHQLKEVSDKELFNSKTKRVAEGITYYQVLQPNSLVVLTKDARYNWQHEIPKSNTFLLENGKKFKKGEDYRRISITCRTMIKK
eukprot:gene2076-1948_t